MKTYCNEWSGLYLTDGALRPHLMRNNGHQINIQYGYQNVFAVHIGTDLWALYNATREKLEELYPGCIFPVPEDEVDADVMRAFSDMQEEYRSMLVDETE